MRRRAATDMDAVSEGDRRFFRRHPGRLHRLRLAAIAELEQAREAGCDLGRPEPGFRHHVLVRRVGPHVRLRAFVQLGEGCDTDLPEELCASLWRSSANPMRDDLQRRIESVTAGAA